MAKDSDADEIMQFIREHWLTNHVLGSSKALLDWQHGAGAHYNFVIGRSKTQGIVGLLGVIPLSRFDNDLAGSRDTVWLTTWKVREEVASGLGLRLLLHVQATWPQARIGTVGHNDVVRRIYEALGYRTGSLTRFALIRCDIAATKLATIPDGWNPPRAAPGDAVFAEIDTSEFYERTAELGLDDSGMPPFKTCAYIQERYVNHPYYTYRVWLATERSRYAVLITRLCTHSGAGALRIVDFIGDPHVLAGAGSAFEELLRTSGAEYLDFFAEGLSSELTAAGLFDAEKVSGLVLPAYFEPFARRNAKLLYSLRGPEGRVILCKGDADQDRPNELP